MWPPLKAVTRMKIRIRIKTEWDMEYRIWDIDRADEDEERLETVG